MLLLTGCRNEKTRPVNFPQLGWTLRLPIDMSFEDSSFDKNGNIIDSNWDYDLRLPGAGLFTIKADRDNYINAVVYKDSTDPDAWKQKTVNDSRYYFSIIAGAPETRVLDSSVSVKTFDDVEFQEEFISYRKKRTDRSWSWQYSRRYNKYAIYINIRYTDKKKGKGYLKMLENSTFEK
jgi:hypothetical protein